MNAFACVIICMGPYFPSSTIKMTIVRNHEGILLSFLVWIPAALQNSAGGSRAMAVPRAALCNLTPRNLFIYQSSAKS